MSELKNLCSGQLSVLTHFLSSRADPGRELVLAVGEKACWEIAGCVSAILSVFFQPQWEQLSVPGF